MRRPVQIFVDSHAGESLDVSEPRLPPRNQCRSLTITIEVIEIMAARRDEGHIGDDAQLRLLISRALAIILTDHGIIGKSKSGAPWPLGISWA